MSTAGKWLVRLFAVVGGLASVAALGFALTGISARREPPRAEVVVARAARGLLLPASAARARNPLPPTPEVLRSARAHWADHCASCHGNDGRGDTQMGRNLYPRAPDMTARATQERSDGELFWIIENGIKLTGMPAWGTASPADDAETWELVQLIRRLPALTEAELAEMKRHNPISRAELEQALARERFLAGEDAPAAPRTPHH